MCDQNTGTMCLQPLETDKTIIKCAYIYTIHLLFGDIRS